MRQEFHLLTKRRGCVYIKLSNRKSIGLYVPVEYPERKVSFKERIAKVHIIIFNSAHLK